MTNENIKRTLALSLLVFTGFLLCLTIFLRFDLGEIQSIFSIVGSVSIGIALLAYIYRKEQDELLATIDQITFFREKIIPEWDAARNKIEQKYPKFILSRIDLKDPTIEAVQRDFSQNFTRQLGVFFDAKTRYPEVSLDNQILNAQILLLNLIEEFSLRVIHLKTVESEALVGIHNVFVEVIEQNAVAIIFMREIKVGSPIYSGILTLYGAWVSNANKASFVKNMYIHGLIDKKQKELIFNKRRENLGV